MDSPHPVPALETKLHTVVADDIPASLRMMVSTLKNRCEIVATACDGFEALDAIRQFNPDLAVLDLTMPGLSGLDVARNVIKEKPQLGIIICTVQQERMFIEAAFAAGARGYVFKTNIYEDLPRAVDAVAAGGVYFPQTDQSTKGGFPAQ